MNGPTLQIRRVGIDTWRENVAYLQALVNDYLRVTRCAHAVAERIFWD